MRRIGQLDTEAQARLFADYLFVHDIEAQVELVKGGPAWAVWIVEEDRVAEGKALLSRFRSMPDAEELQQAAAAAAARRQEQPGEPPAESRRWKPAGALSWLPGAGIVTQALLAIAIVAALATRLGQDPRWTGWLLISNVSPLASARFWTALPEIASGQWWRFVTPVFLHFSLWPLLFNLLWLQDLGTVLERRIGAWRFAGLVALFAAVSNLAQFLAAGAQFGGLSGVVYGVFGYLWVRGKRDFHFHVVFSPLTSGLLLVYLALGIFGVLGPTANAAHFSGFATGGLLGWLAAWRTRES